jgi:hypothetical protein
VGAVRQLTRPGSRVLILAGNANEDRKAGDFRGPPRVTEAGIRADFADGFKLLRLREFRFDPTPAGEGALAWSILLERESRRESARDHRRAAGVSPPVDDRR